MYDTKRLKLGAGLLLAVWGLAGLLIVTSGVAVSMPLSGSGGFTITADYLSAEQSISAPGETDSTASDRLPVAVFEISRSTAQELRITKTLSLDGIPGLNGNARIVLVGDDITLDGVVFETTHISAERAVWRGFVIDERNRDSVFDQFVASAGPNPGRTAGNPVDIEGSGSEPGFELYEAEIEAYSLTVDQVDLSELGVQIQFDPDDDGTYEYGS
jgi:hypothetical protein